MNPTKKIVHQSTTGLIEAPLSITGLIKARLSITGLPKAHPLTKKPQNINNRAY